MTDHLGSVRDIVDDNGTLRKHIQYDSFGNITDEDYFDTAGDPIAAVHAEAIAQLFGYTGRPFDKTTGLQNNLHRWYDPTVGRWLNEDPGGFAMGDANLYRYVGNAATMYVDPSGLSAGENAWAAAKGAYWQLANAGRVMVSPLRWLGVTEALGIEESLKRSDEHVDRGLDRAVGRDTGVRKFADGAATTAGITAWGAGALTAAEAAGISSIGSRPLWGGGAAISREEQIARLNDLLRRIWDEALKARAAGDSGREALLWAQAEEVRELIIILQL